MSQRRVTELKWRIEASLCVDARVRDPAGANARKVDRKGRAKPLEQRNLLNQRRNPAGSSACSLGRYDASIIIGAYRLLFVHSSKSAFRSGAPGPLGRVL